MSNEENNEPVKEQVRFEDLSLSEDVLAAVKKVGYEIPSPIQAATIPYIANGGDVIGQAQTGTGKTAAFALPLLSRIQIDLPKPQVLVLAPTRELAIQVAEAFEVYSSEMDGFNVLPIYGGAPYEGQLRRLKRGVHVVVGTPGRVMDHIDRKTLDLSELKCLVLDEADEMLRMGFIDDVEWILQHTPKTRQVAMFSATMPTAVAKIASRHMKNPDTVVLETKMTIATTITQRYLPVHRSQKLDALTRILEAGTHDAMIIFVRTKSEAGNLTSKLEARGYKAATLNGDVPQAIREKTVHRLKDNQIDILVATDVAARGLDVKRISHVINYDIPGDIEAYVHRVGRTGRAGSTGEAIVFVTPRESHWLRSIEKATRQAVEKMTMPSVADINDVRIEKFKRRITDTVGSDDLKLASEIMMNYLNENDTPIEEVAVALARMVLGESPLLSASDLKKNYEEDEGGFGGKKKFNANGPGAGMARYKLQVGSRDGIRAADIVGAIANEVGISGRQIMKLVIERNFSTVELPKDLPKQTMNKLRDCEVKGIALNATRTGNIRSFNDSKGGRSEGRGGFKGKGGF